MCDEKTVTVQPVLGQSGINLPNEKVVEITENLDKNSLLSLSATSQSALRFFKSERDKIRTDKLDKLKEIESEGEKEYGAIFDNMNANPNLDFAFCKKISIVMLAMLALVSGAFTKFSFKDNPESVYYGIVSASSLLVMSCILGGKYLLSCKDTLFADRKILRVREVRQALEVPNEETVLIPSENENNNDSDNDNRGLGNYGAIN